MNGSDDKNLFDELYREAEIEWNPFLVEAYKDTKFFVGNQWSDADKSYLKSEGRAAYVYNKSRTIINQICGYQRRNRMASVCQPREYNDTEYSDFLTDILLYNMQKCGGYQVLSEAFQGALVAGLNMLSLWMDYSEDLVNGQIKISREPFNSFLIDPYFTKQDLSDCRYIMRRRYVDKDTAKLLIKGKDKFIDELNPGISDGKFTYMTYARRAENAGLLRYDELWQRTSKKAYIIIDEMNKQSIKWAGTKKELDELKKQFPFIEVETVPEKTVELTVFLEGEVVYKGQDPYGIGDFPFVPVLGYYTPEYDHFDYKLQGVMRGLRDAQEEYNMMRSKTTDIIKSQVNSGWMVKEGSVKNPQDLYRTGQGVVIETSMNAQPGDIQKLNPAELSMAFPNMIADLEGQIMTLAGVSEELMGMGSGGNTEVSGTLAAQRSANSLTTLQTLFDNLSYSQKVLGQKIIKMCLTNWTPEKMMRISGKQMPQIDLETVKYDIVVTEGVETQSQRNLHYMQLLEAMRAGIQIPQSALIESMPIADKGKLMEAFQQEQEQQQAQQSKITEAEDMNRKLNNAKIYSDIALAEERLKRGSANDALSQERLAQARQDVSKAELNNLEIIEKLKGMRQDQLIQALSFVQQMEQNQIQDDRQYVQNEYMESSARVAGSLLDKDEEPVEQLENQEGILPQGGQF